MNKNQYSINASLSSVISLEFEELNLTYPLSSPL